MSGCLYGVGVGPGDPELITLKGARLLKAARLIAYFARQDSAGHARRIADSLLGHRPEEIKLTYPVTTEYGAEDPRYAAAIHAFYEHSASLLSARLAAGEDVTVIGEGDPFFYGSFMHLYRRLAPKHPCHIVPGITGMSGCWSHAGVPMTWGDDILTVLPGTLDKALLAQRLTQTDAAVIMKLGRHFPFVRAAIAEAGLLDRALYIEYGTMARERIMMLRDKTDDEAPYFSLILIPGEGRRL